MVKRTFMENSFLKYRLTSVEQSNTDYYTKIDKAKKEKR
jgi:hypothetical protein